MELAKLRLDRAIKLSNNFEQLESDDITQIFVCLSNTLSILPSNAQRDEIYNYLKYLGTMKFEKCGGIFKGTSWKNSVILGPSELTEVVWRVNAVLNT